MKITEKFDRGEFVVTAEVGPPKGIHIEHILEEAKEYLSGITAVNVTDNQSSVMRLGSLATCRALKDEGLTPIFQLTCRDRNRIALQSDLLSAAVMGIDNILCLTGDHTKMGDHKGAIPTLRKILRRNNSFLWPRKRVHCRQWYNKYLPLQYLCLSWPGAFRWPELF